MEKPAAPIPSLLELVGVPEDLEAKAIAKDFLGLSREEAQRMFEEWSSDFMLRYGEGLMFMEEKGVTYYLPAYIDALKQFYGRSDEEERESLLDFDFPNLLRTIGYHAEFSPDTVRKNRAVIENLSASTRVSVTITKIRAVWEEA